MSISVQCPLPIASSQCSNAVFPNARLCIFSPTSPILISLMRRKQPKTHHSLSLALPVGPSSSSPFTASAPAILANSAFCSILLNSVFLGSTNSKALSFALFRILKVPHHQHNLLLNRQRNHHRNKTNLTSAPASTNNSTTSFPAPHSTFANPFTNLTLLCNGVSLSSRSTGSTSTPS